MKKLLVPFVLTLGSAACQHHAPPTQVGSKVVAVSLLPPAAVAMPNEPPPPLPAQHGQLTRANVPMWPVTDSAAVHSFFERHDISRLLLSSTGKQIYPFEGFRGRDKYRLEVVVQHASRAAANPATYQLRGLLRSRHRISRFTGQLTLTALSRLPLLTAEDRQAMDDFSMVRLIRPASEEAARRYALRGRVALAESRDRTTTATFAGQLVLEVALTRSGRLRQDAPFLHGPSQGGGQTCEGTWTDVRAQQPEPAAWAANIVGYGPHIFSDLILGERDVSINPDYAHLGWNEMWENDEWWADSPRPKLNL